MTLPPHKTKIVATIGPASRSPQMLERLIRAGMNVARLNFSHGEFEGHAETIRRLRDAEKATGRRIAIMADLPGPKLRVGEIRPEPVELRAGDEFVLTTEEIIGDARRVSVSVEALPSAVRPGDHLFLNDGLIHVQVREVAGTEVRCRILIGGELRSRKGLNLPGIQLGISAFTDHDRECLEFAIAHGVDAVGQSFVERAADIEALREAARSAARPPMVLAKIERAGALRNLGEILAAADGIMVARGDLGVEVPIEQMAVLQKVLIARANAAAKPVITATQMLESMVTSRLPTRAEATDVANAILDGTDAVMLSGESAVGRYPEEAVAMLARIAAVTEPHRAVPNVGSIDGELYGDIDRSFAGLVEHALKAAPCAAVFVPTKTGSTARMMSRFKPGVWVLATSADPQVCQSLHFTCGVHPIPIEEEPETWAPTAAHCVRQHRLEGEYVLLVTGPSEQHPGANHRLELIPVQQDATS